MIIDIIIPTYNNSEYTVRCLRSIESNTLVPYRIIWVDDGSAITECQRVLDKLEGSEIEFKIDGTIENKGFARTVNAGIRLSESDPIVLLNNDVTVTKGWLRKLLFGFKLDERVGIIGPVTNRCGSKQQYGRLARILGLSAVEKPDEFFNSREPAILSVDSNISYFCTAISRELVDTIGFLDEGFFNGGEDDDYNDRARFAGFKTVIMLNCFVWHEHGATRRHVMNPEMGRRNSDLYYRKKAKRWGYEDTDHTA